MLVWLQAKKLDRKLERVALTISLQGIRMVDCNTGDTHLEFSIYRWEIETAENGLLLSYFVSPFSKISTKLATNVNMVKSVNSILPTDNAMVRTVQSVLSAGRMLIGESEEQILNQLGACILIQLNPFTIQIILTNASFLPSLSGGNWCGGRQDSGLLSLTSGV